MKLIVSPIGFLRSPFREKAEAPRQGIVGRGSAATVELRPEYRDALEDLEGFERIWLVSWFDRVTGWRPKVTPPRSDRKRGVFATRSPHRPNPIGITVVRLLRIDGLVLHVEDIDLVDGTPLLDIKPYLAYADAFPDTRMGWLERRDPCPAWSVSFELPAEEALAWITTATGLDLRSRIVSTLSLGPQPHAYRRIRELSDGSRVLATKDWRVRFRIDDAPGRRLVVERIGTGYRARDLARGRESAHELHREFVERFGLF